MSERYQKLSALPENLYLEGAPLLIAAGALLKDNQGGRVLVQLKLQNLDQSRLVACKVSIRALDPSGAELEGIADHAYLDLTVDRGGTFGTQEPIYLPDHTTRSVLVAVTQAVFQDGKVWQSPGGEWRTITDKRRRPAEMFEDPEVQRQYTLELWNNCTYVPVQTGSLFLCACGAVNLAKDTTCSKCRRNFAELLQKADLEDLTRKKDARLAREKAENLERERKAEEERLERERKAEEEKKLQAQQEEERRIAAEKTKKRNKKIAVVVAILAVVIAVATGAVMFVQRVVIPGNKYKAAEALLEAGDYDRAVAAFTELGEYKDAAERILEVYYHQGEALFESQNYDGAIAAFTSAGEYTNAAERIPEVYYRQGEALLESQNYDRAIRAFMSAGKYKDAAERIQDSYYRKGEKLFEAQNYDGAIVAFTRAGKYTDAAERIQESYYYLGVGYQESGEFQEAKSAFIAAGSYGDSKQKVEQIYDIAYNMGLEKMQQEDYEKAWQCFNFVGKKYPDAANYGGYCEIKSINFSDGNVHNLAEVMATFRAITDEALSEELKSIPQIRMVMQLEGTWEEDTWYFPIRLVFRDGKVVRIDLGTYKNENILFYVNGKYIYYYFSPSSRESLEKYGDRLTNITEKSLRRGGKDYIKVN